MDIPLLPLEVRARNHATLCSVGFLILLPVGVLVARYARTFTNRWFWAHTVIQLLVSAPIIFTGWAMGYQLAEDLQLDHFTDPHQKMGLALLILYVIQLIIGMLIHYVKIPTCGTGRRPIQNYVHVFLGWVILVLAASQVHYGLDTEWNLLGGLHPVPPSPMKAYIAVLVIFWVLYLGGLALLRRQFQQERKSRRQSREHIQLENGAQG